MSVFSNKKMRINTEDLKEISEILEIINYRLVLPSTSSVRRSALGATLIGLFAGFPVRSALLCAGMILICLSGISSPPSVPGQLAYYRQCRLIASPFLII